MSWLDCFYWNRNAECSAELICKGMRSTKNKLTTAVNHSIDDTWFIREKGQGGEDGQWLPKQLHSGMRVFISGHSHYCLIGFINPMLYHTWTISNQTSIPGAFILYPKHVNKIENLSNCKDNATCSESNLHLKRLLRLESIPPSRKFTRPQSYNYTCSINHKLTASLS